MSSRIFSHKLYIFITLYSFKSLLIMKTANTNNKIQLIKFGIGIVVGIAIYLLIKAIF